MAWQLGKSMVLEDKDILQIDATVIAGVLILLTLSFGISDTTSGDSGDVTAKKIIKGTIIISIIGPFSFSAMLVIEEILSPNPRRKPGHRTALRAMQIGFGYVIAGIFIFSATELNLL